eukprot:TRINITY_DN3098_c0_g1_i1.p1 TRINITY_DN3098_c0_g1~~TRINITY_DN3098_c0_g1_i1.p1  ORF type:complete len:411 (+),score=65.68 TRINITY_DN3098_c0_g1_i1:49-1233(+)
MASPAHSLSAILSHDLQRGVDVSGDIDIWRSPAAEELVEYLHDAVSRRRAGGSGDAGPAAAAMSLRCFYAYLRYAKRLKKEVDWARVDELSGITNAAYEAEFGSNIWALIHHLTVDTTSLPGTGYVEVFRGMYESTLLQTLPEIHKRCQKALQNLPPVPSSILYHAADTLDPISQLYITLNACMEREDDVVVQSQIAQIASDWCSWLVSEPDVIGEYMLGLCKLSRTSVLHKMLFMTHLFGVIGGVLPHNSEQARFVSCLSDVCKEYSEMITVFHAGSLEAEQLFAKWRAVVHSAYNDLVVTPPAADDSYEPPAVRIRENAVATNIGPFFEYLFTILDILSVSSDLTTSSAGVLGWDEFLVAIISYLQPDLTLKGIKEWVSGPNSIFHQLRHFW